MKPTQTNYPKTRQEMIRAGYTRKSNFACRNCSLRCEWWRSPRGAFVGYDLTTAPLGTQDAEDTTPAVLHSATCKRKPAEPEQQSLFTGTLPERQKAVGLLAASCHARLVVVLQDDAMVYSNRPGISSEDLRQELITAANKIRRDLGGFTE